MRTFAWLSLVMTIGCTRTNPLAITGDGGAGDGGGSECSSFMSRDSCNADSACIAVGCPSGNCDGVISFVGCNAKNGPLPNLNCPATNCSTCHGLDQASCAARADLGCIVATCCGSYQGCLNPGEGFGCTCASCSGLDETTCKSRSDCQANYCPTCQGGQVYSGCAEAGTPPPICEGPPCPVGCDQVTTQTDCDARSDCHSVFTPGACGCANCCCTFFSHCASGAFADCKGPAFCNSAPPDCNNPACNGAFTVAYANMCYDGCVKQTACAP